MNANIRLSNKLIIEATVRLKGLEYMRIRLDESKKLSCVV